VLAALQRACQLRKSAANQRSGRGRLKAKFTF
jgi:hypothetical protein